MTPRCGPVVCNPPSSTYPDACCTACSPRATAWRSTGSAIDPGSFTSTPSTTTCCVPPLEEIRTLCRIGDLRRDRDDRACLAPSHSKIVLTRTSKMIARLDTAWPRPSIGGGRVIGRARMYRIRCPFGRSPRPAAWASGAPEARPVGSVASVAPKRLKCRGLDVDT